MNEMSEKTERIKQKCGDVPDIFKDKLDIFDWEHIFDATKKNYVKGLLYGIVTDDTDINQLAENVIDQVVTTHVISLESAVQKVILGEISDCVDVDKATKSQVVAVSVKIGEFLLNTD